MGIFRVYVNYDMCTYKMNKYFYTYTSYGPVHERGGGGETPPPFTKKYKIVWKGKKKKKNFLYFFWEGPPPPPEVQGYRLFSVASTGCAELTGLVVLAHLLA